MASPPANQRVRLTHPPQLGNPDSTRPGRAVVFHIKSIAAKPKRGVDLKFAIEVSPEEVRNEATILTKIDDREVRFKLRRQIEAGTRIRIPGEGQSRNPDGPRGDLYLIIHIQDGLLWDLSTARPLKAHAPDEFDYAAKELRYFLVSEFGKLMMDKLQRRGQILVLGIDEYENGDKETYFLSSAGLRRTIRKKNGPQSTEAITLETAIRALVRTHSVPPQNCVSWIKSQSLSL